MRDSLPKDIQDRVRAQAPASAPNRFYNCAVCGQRVDRINLAQVYHHDERPHEQTQSDRPLG